jgi:hypothetical protein
MGRGKISPMTIHAAGPQVVAKKKILMQMNAAMAEMTELLFKVLSS